MLEIGFAGIIVIIIGLIVGFFMIDTTPSNVARLYLEGRLTELIPDPDEVNEKLNGFFDRK